MDYKHLTLELKADAEAGTIEGYGAIFGNKDLGGDIIQPGAFAESLASGRKVKMLREHDPSRVVGIWSEASEDAAGLRLKGRILTDVRDGAEAHALVKAGAIDGLSIGYRITSERYVQGARVIEKAEVWEVSLVTFPMNEFARVDAVKAAAMSRRDMERLLTQDAGLSRSVARQLLAGGFEGIKSMQDAGDVDELAALLRARANL